MSSEFSKSSFATTGSNTAVADLSADNISSQISVIIKAAQSSCHATNRQPTSGVAVSERVDPVKKSPTHVAPQSIPDGSEEMLPFPDTETVTCWVGAVAANDSCNDPTVSW